MSLIFSALFVLGLSLGQCTGSVRNLDADTDGFGVVKTSDEGHGQGMDSVNDYMRKLYNDFSSIPDGADIPDLSAQAIKPHKGKGYNYSIN